jgi:predicted TIM-barrel fold metal-dependent hydrolase
VRTIAIEEHFGTPAIAAATGDGEWARAARELGQPEGRAAEVITKLADLDDGRIAAMDSGGIDVQVLSHTQPGVEGLPPVEAVVLAREANDFLAAAIARHPDRLSGFAMLPTPDPDRAADELERSVSRLKLRGGLVNGRTGERYLDHRTFWPIFERAEQLGVPIYLHPGLPPSQLREAWFGGLPPAVAYRLSIAAWGWHIDTGVHALRLITSGVFDRYPRLQIIIGHMGEAIPFMVDRTNRTLPRQVTALDREIKDYFVSNFYVTTSGFFAAAPLQCLLLVSGADRVMFSVDYPYSSNEDGRLFLDSAPISAADREKIAHVNAERLLGL